MYVLAKNNSIVALDASTGKEVWTYTPDPAAGIITNRGINYWESKDRSDRRLLFCRQSLRSRRSMPEPESRFRRSATAGRVDLKEGLGRDPKHLHAGPIHHARPRVRGPADSGLGDQRRIPVGPRRHPRLRRAHRQAGLDVSHHPASRRVRLRHLAARMRGRPSAAPMSGASSRWTRSAASSMRPPPAPSTTSTARTARAPTCSAIACSRWMPAPASACGTSRWSITTFGITTTPPRRSC